MKFYILLLLLIFISPINSYSKDSVVELGFYSSDNKIVSFSKQHLIQNLKTHIIEYYDPHYEKTKKFKAFSLHDILNLGFKDEWKDTHEHTDISFIALDGYEAIANIELVINNEGYIAYEDIKYDGWEKIGRKKADPAPFYLVWLKKDQTPANKFPWPWQLSSIKLVKFKDQYPEVHPGNIKASSNEYKGFIIYKDRCLRCHSINKQGGKVGPDLNDPKSILEYRSIFMIKEMIKHPSKYRHTHMPDHPDLSEADLDNLIKYFQLKRDQKS